MSYSKAESAPQNYQFSYEDLWSDDEQKTAQAWAKLQNDAAIAYKTRPGFFTPFRSFGEFGSTLAAPVVAPLILGLIAGVAAVAAAAATLTAIGSLLVSGSAAFVGLFNENAKDVSHDALGIAALAGIVTAVCAIATVALTLLAAIITPLAIASLVTRSLSTIFSPVVDCISNCTAADEDDFVHQHVRATI